MLILTVYAKDVNMLLISIPISKDAPIPDVD